MRATLGFEVLMTIDSSNHHLSDPTNPKNWETDAYAAANTPLWYSAPIIHTDGVDTITLSLANATLHHGATIVSTRPDSQNFSHYGTSTRKRDDTIWNSEAKVRSVSVYALRYLWGSTPCSGVTYSCPIYVHVPRLGGLSGENDMIPLGPAVLALNSTVTQY